MTSGKAYSALRWIVSGVTFALAAPAYSTISGTVLTAAGQPIEGCRVAVVEGGPATTTGAQGRFSLSGVTPPVRLEVSHPRFRKQPVEVGAGAAQQLEIRLQPRQEVYEEITVSATRDASGTFQPVSVAASSLRPGRKAAPPARFVDVIEGVPGVAESGQGGHFQTFSVRGVAGQRVLNLFAGAPIFTERRAGVALSFADPLILGTIDVLRGPSSSYYGSGALGGVIQAFPRRFEGLQATAGYATGGDEAYQLVGWGDDSWSVGLAHRKARDATTPDGERIFSRFERYSASVERFWGLGEKTSLELVLLPAAARDIGKPNVDYPQRTTLYPEENHLVASLTARKSGSYRANVWAHPNELVTEATEGAERSLVDDEATDFGANAQWELSLPWKLAGRAGLDYVGRRSVRAVEETFVDGVRVDTASTLDGDQDTLAAYGTVRRPLGRATLEAGTRFTWLTQGNAGFDRREDTAWTGFAGATMPLGGGFELAANAGTGFRFPTLSERFFTGTTGRGEVISNLDLESERSISADLGLRYYGSRLFVAGYLFRSRVDDYIERITLEPGVRTFVNRTQGTLEGVELEGFFQATRGVRLSWEGQYTDGESDRGETLADVAPHRIAVQGDWEGERWSLAARLQHRFDKDDVGPGEQPVAAAEILSLTVGYDLRPGLHLSLSGDNLLDETYLPSADEQSVPAPERSLGLALHWSP